MSAADLPLFDRADSWARLSPCGLYRYALGRVWGAEERAAVWVMLNPSTADAHVDDPTIRRVRSFSEREGCNALTVVNLFAYRSPNPSDLIDAAQAGIDPIGPDNETTIIDHLTADDVGLIVVAWGAGAEPLAKAVANQPAMVDDVLARTGRQAFCLGTTKAGHPRHPLYVRGDQELIPWEMVSDGR